MIAVCNEYICVGSQTIPSPFFSNINLKIKQSWAEPNSQVGHSFCEEIQKFE